ncbi:condensation domain-containing protein [Streptomyces poriferorum]|uniref:Condensation domain-containing protein n=2 Tax=Streptomyces poriferorum TaxID=2798799 RepID=A0ABY9ILT7_9ACTN|nr:MULTISPECIES: condensation domain-containing protein [unclassified Streptomyces]MDP5317077.1 condensation domain-containing protein [Streptomyces sp. Alt4]WLQ55349.1 condensation domain-containing protein [Streptomyces sp. Alt2]
MDDSRTGSSRFHGRRADRAPMTWGQQAIWKSIRWLGEGSHYFNIRRTLPVPPGRTEAQVAAALGQLLSRHEALRTHFRQAATGPEQEVTDEGTFAYTVYDTSPGTGAETAGRLAQELAGTAFDHDRELPLRCALVLEAGAPGQLALAFSHLGVDFWAVRELLADLAALLYDRAGPAPDWQPLDQAAFETEGAGAARGTASLAYWRTTLSRVPPAMFTRPADDPAPDRFVRLRMDSPAVAVATTALADRCRVSTQTVLLAATAAVLGSYSGHNTAVLQLIAVNRHDERSRRLIAAMAENALFAVDSGTGSFEELVRRTFLVGMNAYRHAQYDPLAMDEVLEEAKAASGGELDLSCFFNDKRMHDRWPGLPATDGSAEQLRALTEKTEVSCVGVWERQDATFFVHTAYEPDTCLLHLMADTRLVPRPEIERLLRSFETLLVESVAGTVALETLR